MKIALSAPTAHTSLYLLGVFFVVCMVPASAHAETSNAPISVSKLVALTNQDRAANGVQALQEDSRLSAAAQRKAEDMVRQGYFSHISPNGNKPWSWLVSSGYYYTRAGENLAKGFSTSEVIEQAWMQSPSHKSNIVDKSFTKVGVGIARGLYRGEQTTFVVQFFAAPYVSKPAALGRVAIK